MYNLNSLVNIPTSDQISRLEGFIQLQYFTSTHYIPIAMKKENNPPLSKMQSNFEEFLKDHTRRYLTLTGNENKLVTTAHTHVNLLTVF